jgi:hypothetical protein
LYDSGLSVEKCQNHFYMSMKDIEVYVSSLMIPIIFTNEKKFYEKKHSTKKKKLDIIKGIKK